MTLTRLSLLAMAFCGLNLVACGDKDTGDTMEEGDADADTDADGDTDADADTDADTDVGNYFEPALMNWTFEGGIVGGEPVTVTGSHGDIPPLFYFELYEKEYLDGYDDRYTCMIAFEPTIGAGTSGTDAWLDLTFENTTLYYSDCDNLDPNVYGTDPAAAFAEGVWEMTVEPMSSTLVDMFIKWVGEDKWATDYEPYTFAGSAWYEGQAYEGDENPQVMWGVAWTLDGTTLADDAELIETDDIAMGVDGFYRLLPIYLWYLQ